LKAYRVDFCGLQEMKTVEPFDRQLVSGHRLVAFGQTDGRHGGIGFAVSNKLNQYLQKYKKISERVGYADFAVPSSLNKRDATIPIRFVIAYGPTNPNAKRDPQLRDKFYDELSAAFKTPSKRTLAFGLGDFNSKVGVGECSSVGPYSKGSRNEHGQALVDWVQSSCMLLANTLFRYSVRHRTTWTGRIMDAATGAPKSIYNMIDYIVVPQHCKPLVKKARSYAGTLTSSDHKMVIADMEFFGIFKIYDAKSKKKMSQLPLAVQKLSNVETKAKYQAVLKEELTQFDTQPSETHQTSPHLTTWEQTTKAMTKAAESTVGRMHRSTSGRLLLPNEEVAKLERNRIMHKIRNIQRDDANKRIDVLAEAVESAPDSAKMFVAASAMKTTTRQPLVVQTGDGHVLVNDSEKVTCVREHFAKQFSSDTEDSVDKPPAHQLITPIQPGEVVKAALRLKNQKASGPDDIPGELLKYGCNELSTVVATLINTCIESGDDLSSVIGSGTLIPLNKANKQKGPVANMRPITLINTIRKVFSLIVLGRISAQVSKYLGAAQSGFRAGRSTSDVVWSQRWLAAKALRYHWDCHILGLDMSRAFLPYPRA